MRRLLRRSPAKPMIPAKTSHLHEECVVAGDCNAKGWCFGETCEVIVPERPGGGRPRASGRCRICRRRLLNNERALRFADPISRHPEGFDS